MLFVALGALVLMPLVTGLDTSVSLFTAGIGTLIFQLIAKNKSPSSSPHPLPLLLPFFTVFKLGVFPLPWAV